MILSTILNAKGHSVFTVSPKATLAEAITSLVEHNCGSMLVCDGDQVIGIITERDILRACATHASQLDQIPVEAHMTQEVLTGSPNDKISDVMGLMTDRHIRHLPILEKEKLVGMISIGDVVKAQHDHLTLENHLLKNYIQS